MYVCNCNGLNERAVDKAISDGAKTAREVYRYHGCQVRCGRCAEEICERLRDSRGESRSVIPVLVGLPAFAT